MSSLLGAEGLELSLTGFEPAEIDALFADLTDPENDPTTNSPKSKQEPSPVAVTSGCWETPSPDVRRRRQADSAGSWREAVRLWSSPIRPTMFAFRKWSVGGRIKHRDFANASGELSPAEFTDFNQVSDSLRRIFAGRGTAFGTYRWRHMRELLDEGSRLYTEMKNLIVWTKTNAGQGSSIDPRTN